MEVKLIKISKNDNDLRTDEIEGTTESIPIVGKSFTMVGEGIEYGSRLVSTSLVTEIMNPVTTRDGYFIKFKTMNSTYMLQLLEDNEV